MKVGTSATQVPFVPFLSDYCAQRMSMTVCWHMAPPGFAAMWVRFISTDGTSFECR